MSFFVFVLTFAIAVQAHLTDDQRAELKKDKEACIASSGVKAELVEDTKKGVFAKDPALNEFMFCLGKRIGFLNEAGEFQIDVIKAEISVGHSTEEAEALIDACAINIQATPQLTSLELSKCIYEKSADHISIA